MLKEEIKEIARNIFPEVILSRRHLHAHPELSFEEYNTAAFIKKKLSEMGISFESMAGTGIVALIHGDLPSTSVVALRADIDALPIQEIEGREYGSTRPGVMHACGHDVHSSSLL